MFGPGAYAFQIELGRFLDLPRRDRLVCLNAFTRAIAETNEARLRSSTRRIPTLYASGVHYQVDPIGMERWKDVDACLDDGWADCKSLTAWRVAELWRAGERGAQVLIDEYPDQRPDGPDYHVLIRRADGSTEDPSQILGMR